MMRAAVQLFGGKNDLWKKPNHNLLDLLFLKASGQMKVKYD